MIKHVPQAGFFFVLLAVFACVSCSTDGDGKVDYHLSPPFSYHTITFAPIDLDSDREHQYRPKKFYTPGERLSGIKPFLLLTVGVAPKDKAELLTYTQGTTITVRFSDEQGDPFFSLHGPLAKFPYKAVKSDGPPVFKFALHDEHRTYDFRPFSERIAAIEIKIQIQDNTNYPSGSRAVLHLQEIRGK